MINQIVKPFETISAENNQLLAQTASDENILLLTDSYKVTHHLQTPPKMRYVHSYFESRKGRWPKVTFFGLQYILKCYLTGRRVTKENINEAKEYFGPHLKNELLFNEKGWMHILHNHGGCLPISIKAVPEGTTIPVSNVLMTVENTDPQCFWLTNYLETLLVQTWYPATVCTNGRESKKILWQFLEETGDSSTVDFKLHDFGFRGSTTVESAGIGGAAHLVNFKGTDTIAALKVARRYYHEPMAGFSIPAAEHYTITSWGKENEAYAYANMLEKFPEGYVAVVSDSYDIFNACENIWGKELREKVLSRNGTLVIRPDSGNPPEIVPQVLDILGKAFGCETNSKGYRVLNPKVRVIQGDGIDYDVMRAVLEAMKDASWSADNITFGSGGGLLQKVNRDSQSFAFKCSADNIDGVWHDVSKNPVTDPGKCSKVGRLALVKTPEGGFKTVRMDGNLIADELVEVFRDGALLKDWSFSEIRERAKISA